MNQNQVIRLGIYTVKLNVEKNTFTLMSTIPIPEEKVQSVLATLGCYLMNEGILKSPNEPEESEIFG